MPTNINNNYSPETEATNQLYNTQIPSLSEGANIQEALRLYHYGVASNLPVTNDAIQPQSVAGHLKNLKLEISSIQAKGLGSAYLSSMPSTPDNGYIWIDANSSASIAQNGRPIVSFFQPLQPTSGMVPGMIWIDSDSNPLSIYAYTGTSWELISSGGSETSYVPGGNANLTLTGLSVDVSAAPTGFFEFNPGTGNQPFGVGLNITSGYSKNIVSLSIGAATSISAAGQLVVYRVINQNPLSSTPVAGFTYSNGANAFSYHDVHGQAAGTNVSYVIINATTDSITFSSASSSAIQISVQEAA